MDAGRKSCAFLKEGEILSRVRFTAGKKRKNSCHSVSVKMDTGISEYTEENKMITVTIQSLLKTNAIIKNLKMATKGQAKQSLMFI